MAFDFPATPAVGQQFPVTPVAGKPIYKWDGEKWAVAGAGSLPIYSDGSVPMSAQLTLAADPVAATDAADKSYVDKGVRSDFAQSLTITQREQARKNIFAAPFDAMAFNGMQVNGSFDVSQENGTTPLNLPSGSGVYITDMWQGVFAGTSGGIIQSGQAASGFPGLPNAMYLRATTAAPLSSTNDFAGMVGMIEGSRLQRCGLGTVNATSITIAFLVQATVPGWMAVSLSDGTNSRSVVKDVFITTANVWEFKTVTFNGDTGGAAWANGPNLGMQVFFVFGGGTGWRATTPGVWENGAKRTTVTTGNFFASNNNQVAVTGVLVLPGNEAPAQERITLIQRPASFELPLCSRYFQYRFASVDFQASVATVVGIGNTGYAPEMRIAPSLSINSIQQQSNVQAGSVNLSAGGTRGFALQVQAQAAARCYYYAEVKCNARF
jgi:hypothetical protein